MEKKKSHRWLKWLFVFLFWTTGIGLTAGIFWYKYENKILLFLLEKLSEEANAPIEASGLEVSLWKHFPKVGLELKDFVLFQGEKKDTLAKAKVLDLRFDVKKLWDGIYEVESLGLYEGEIWIKEGQDGKLNWEEMGQKNDTLEKKASSLSFDLDQFDVKETLINYSSPKTVLGVSLKESKGKIHIHDTLYTVSLQSIVYLEKTKGTGADWLGSKMIDLELPLVYHPSEKTLGIEKGKLKINGVPLGFDLSLGLMGKHTEIDLKFRAEESSLKNLSALLPHQFTDDLKLYKSSGFLKLEGEVMQDSLGKLAYWILVECKEGHIVSPDKRGELKGLHFFVHLKKQKNGLTTLLVPSLIGELNGKTIAVSLDYHSNRRPQAKLQADAQLSAGDILPFVTSQFSALSGELTLEADIEMDILKGKPVHVKGEGELRFEQGEFQLISPNLGLEEIEASLLYNGSSLAMNTFNCVWEGNKLEMNGFLSDLFESKPKGKIDIKAGKLSLDSLLQQISRLKTEGGQDVEGGESEGSEVPDIEVNLSAEELTFQKHVVSELKLSFKQLDNELSIKPLQFVYAKGKIEAEVLYYTTTPVAHRIWLKTNVSDLEINELLKMNDDFGQKDLTQEHLFGRLNGDIEALLGFDESWSFKRKSLFANADVVLQEGRLYSFEPAKALGKFLNDEALHDWRFSDLKNTFHIQNDSLFIPEMVIRSNAVELNVNGYYTFSDSLNLNLQIPLKNWQKHDKDGRFGKTEEAISEGRLFLHVYGPAGSPTVRFDRKKAWEGFKGRLKAEGKEFKDLFKKKRR